MRITDRMLCAYNDYVAWRIHYSLRWLGYRFDRLIERADGLPLVHAWLCEVDSAIVMPLCWWLTRHGFSMFDD